MADRFFAEPEETVRGWASAASEQRRIVSAVEAILAEPSSGDGDVLIVSHGGVGTLLMCALLNVPISRALDQPGQGCWYRFDRDTRQVHHRWRWLEELAALPKGSRS